MSVASAPTPSACANCWQVLAMHDVRARSVGRHGVAPMGTAVTVATCIGGTRSV